MRHPVHQFLHHAEGGGAILDVLSVPDHIVRHLSAGEMWKTDTIPGPDLIDAAHVGLQIQELTGLDPVHPVAIAVQPEPSFAKGLGGHAQMPGDPADICFREGGRHLPATVGAGEAIYFGPDFPVDLLDHIIQPAWRIVFCAGQEGAHAAFMVSHFFSKGFEIDCAGGGCHV